MNKKTDSHMQMQQQTQKVKVQQQQMFMQQQSQPVLQRQMQMQHVQQRRQEQQYNSNHGNYLPDDQSWYEADSARGSQNVPHYVRTKKAEANSLYDDCSLYKKSVLHYSNFQSESSPLFRSGGSRYRLREPTPPLCPVSAASDSGKNVSYNSCLSTYNPDNEPGYSTAASQNRGVPGLPNTKYFWNESSNSYVSTSPGYQTEGYMTTSGVTKVNTGVCEPGYFTSSSSVPYSTRPSVSESSSYTSSSSSRMMFSGEPSDLGNSGNSSYSSGYQKCQSSYNESPSKTSSSNYSNFRTSGSSFSGYGFNSF